MCEARVLPRSARLAFIGLLGLLMLVTAESAVAQTTAGAPIPTPDTTAADEQPQAQTGVGGGPKNVVLAQNLNDGRLRVRGNVQLGRIPGPTAAPVNLARAYSSCVDCQTLAVALQLDLVTAGTHQAAPENVAVALNYECTGCHTVALALQYMLTVDDPTQVPDEANRLMARMHQELAALQSDPNLTLGDAEARVLAVVAEFEDLRSNLTQQRDETVETTSQGASPPEPVSPA
jgi:hypothetical protein